MTAVKDGRVEINGTIYLPSIREDGSPSGDWIPMFDARDLFGDD